MYKRVDLMPKSKPPKYILTQRWLQRSANGPTEIYQPPELNRVKGDLNQYHTKYVLDKEKWGTGV